MHGRKLQETCMLRCVEGPQVGAQLSQLSHVDAHTVALKQVMGK